MARCQRVLREMERKAKMVKTSQNFIEFLGAPIPLMLVGLDSNHINRHAGIQAAVDQDFIVCRSIKIIDEQCGVWVCFMCRSKNTLDKLNSAKLLANAGHGIIIFIEDRHNHDLVDNVPHIYYALEIAHVAADTSELALQNLIIGVLHKPVGTNCMPAQWMPL